LTRLALALELSGADVEVCPLAAAANRASAAAAVLVAIRMVMSCPFGVVLLLP
jgi:hypothetical protein